MGFLSMIAATGLFVASNGFAMLGIIAMGIGIVLFTDTRRSFGTTSPRDLRARVSVATNSGLFERPERPRLQTVGKAPINLNLENEVAAVALRKVNEITRIGGIRSDNKIRADEITIPLLTPCVAVVADLFHLTQEGVRWNRIQIE